MFLKKHKKVDAPQEGVFEQAPLHLGPASHHGIPRTSSRLAFDPTQRLLAIGTLDGKIKLIGKNGIEGILVSASQTRCKFLEFANNQGFLVHVTAENDLQIWDLERRELTQTHRWHTNVTAFAMIQGSPFMYIGEDSGDIAVLEYDREQRKLRQMPYGIPLQVTRGGVAKSFTCFVSVNGILPFPEIIHSRVLIAYSDGVIVVWSVFDSHIKAIRTVSGKQLDEGLNLDDDDEDDEKDVCCICWADSSGDVLAIGYTDGDIWLWDVAVSSTKSSSQSNVPLIKLQLSSDDSRSPVLALRWCAGGRKEAASSIGGHLFVYGGGGFGCSESFMVFSLKTAVGRIDMPNVHHVDIPLEGLFEDMILLPGLGATLSDQASALLVLTSQGQLHAYDEASISKCLEANEESLTSSLPEPVPINPFTTESIITVTKLAQLSEDGRAAQILSKLPRHFRGNLPSVLPGGSKWPVTGGILNKISGEGSDVLALLFTGHQDGSVNVWDASSSVFFHLCNLPTFISPKLLKITSGLVVSYVEFCSSRGILLVARGSVVFVYKVNAEPREVRCILYQLSEIQDEQVHQDAGFQCVAILNTGVAVVSISISNGIEHVAIGHIDGTVQIFDIDQGILLVNETVSKTEQKNIRSLAFGPGVKMSAPSDSSRTPASSSRGMLYAAEDLSFAALLYSNGHVFPHGPWHVDDSRILYMCCLEIFNEQKGEGMTGADQYSERSTDEGKCTQEADLCSHYLIVCTQVSACVYCCSVSNQVVSLTSLKMARFPTPCSSASTFFCQSAHAYRIVLLNNAATLEIRSLPGLDVVQQFSMAGIYNLDPKVSENPAFLCGDKGLAALVDVKREIVMFSILSGDENSRSGDDPVSFFDKDVAAAGEAALKAGSLPPRRKSQLQGLIGGVLKELKVGGVLKEIKGGLLKSPKSGKEEATGSHETDSLSKIFTSPLSTDGVGSARLEKISHAEIPDSAPELDIDDIDIDDEETTTTGSSEKVPETSKSKKVSDPLDDRKSLFDGDEDNNKPVRRSPDEIRAKYGHRPLGDVSGAAGLARDKLLERHEKLQALGKRTEEMQEGAQNFASMAAELAKTMEGRKWWQL